VTEPAPESTESDIGYAEAVAELESILVELERITSARMQVDSVMAELERATDLGAEG
jgi:hypothetical protein